MEQDFAEARRLMVEHQIRARGVSNERVLAAMREVPRHLFVPEDLRYAAYGDHPLPIGEEQTISQPYIVAVMTELLSPEPGDRILEIGTGSGYQAAVLGRIVREVWSVERIASVAAQAERNLEAVGAANVHVVVGDGTLGLPERAPYDGIIVTAAAPSVPEPLFDQVADGDMGYGVNSLESLSMGICTVTNLSAAYEEFIPDHPFFTVTPGNLERRLKELLEDRELRLRHAAAGPSWIRKRHHWKTVAEHLHKRYRELGWSVED